MCPYEGHLGIRVTGGFIASSSEALGTSSSSSYFSLPPTPHLLLLLLFTFSSSYSISSPPLSSPHRLFASCSSFPLPPLLLTSYSSFLEAAWRAVWGEEEPQVPSRDLFISWSWTFENIIFGFIFQGSDPWCYIWVSLVPCHGFV